MMIKFPIQPQPFDRIESWKDYPGFIRFFEIFQFASSHDVTCALNQMSVLFVF